MIRPPAHVLVTGADGFIGRRLVAALAAHDAFAQARFTLSDRQLSAAPDRRFAQVEGNIADPAVTQALTDGRPDLVFHLAGILGGAAEAEYSLSRRVNLDATLTLIEGLRDAAVPPRIVFASSIAVFGPPLPALIDDDTMPFPTMTYGAQKRMVEIALEQFGARGWIDGIALRLPGIVARPDADARLKSAFLNTLFYAFASGDNIVLPVSPDATTWLISVPACVAALLHAGLLPAERIGRRRALTLPAQCVSFGKLIAALRRAWPDSASAVRYDPDPAIEAQFGNQPPLVTPLANALGFVHDGDIDTLVARAMPACVA